MTGCCIRCVQLTCCQCVRRKQFGGEKMPEFIERFSWCVWRIRNRNLSLHHNNKHVNSINFNIMLISELSIQWNLSLCCVIIYSWNSKTNHLSSSFLFDHKRYKKRIITFVKMSAFPLAFFSKHSHTETRSQYSALAFVKRITGSDPVQRESKRAIVRTCNQNQFFWFSGNTQLHPQQHGYTG